MEIIRRLDIMGQPSTLWRFRDAEGRIRYRATPDRDGMAEQPTSDVGHTSQRRAIKGRKEYIAMMEVAE